MYNERTAKTSVVLDGTHDKAALPLDGTLGIETGGKLVGTGTGGKLVGCLYVRGIALPLGMLLLLYCVADVLLIVKLS